MKTTVGSHKKHKQNIHTSNAIKVFQQTASIENDESDEALEYAQQFIEEHFEKVTTNFAIFILNFFFL